MTRTGDNDNGRRTKAAKEIAVEFSNTPQKSRWDESTPSRGAETKTSDLPAQAAVVFEFQAPPPLPRRIANRYDVVGFLGTGGQAEVYLANDTTLGRKVAIKISKADHALSQQEQELFLREARAIASLRHLGIVTVHDFGVHDDGRGFIVLEYLPGQSLKDCLKKPDAKQYFTLERTLELIRQVTEALHYAHQRGVYHRDLKPGNILLDEHGNPHISDFGLAVTQESQRGLKGQIAGTAAYMSPEQVRGESDWLSGQADIWALGLILYEMLAGRRPFQGRSEEEIYKEILDRSPIPLRQINSLIPSSVERVVMTCLEKEAVRRYATAGDLARDLKACLVLPVENDNISTPAEPLAKQRPINGRRLWSALAGLALFLVSATLIGSYWASLHSSGKAVAAKVPAGPRQWERGTWNNLLDRPPEVVRWDATSPTAAWHFEEAGGKVVVRTNGKALLRLGEIREKNYDLRLTIQQTPWTANGNAGLFFGYAPLDQQGDLVHYQIFAIESNLQNAEMPFSIDRLHIIEHPVKRPPYPQVHIAAAEEIAHPPFGSITVMVSIRDNRVDRVTVDGKELPQLRISGAADIVASTHGPVTLSGQGVFGIYFGSSAEGSSGEFLKAELFLR